jgi:hypothetical protein
MLAGDRVRVPTCTMRVVARLDRAVTRILAASVLAAGIVAPENAATADDAGAWTARPAVPAAIAVPDAAKLVAHFHAVGAQVYVCTAAPGTATYAWTLEKPDASLFDQHGTAVGSHGAGPSWTSKDGSSVSGRKVAQADAPDAGAIPWLLVRAEKTSGHGVFSDVTFVQRVTTMGGKHPPTGCSAAAAGVETRAGYSADYYFFTGGAPG